MAIVNGTFRRPSRSVGWRVLTLLCALLIQLTSATLVSADELTPVPTVSAGVATVRTGANLRAGPGTNYSRVGGAKAGQTIEIVARNPAGDWYQLASGAWIFGNLVENAPDVPVAMDIPTPPASTPDLGRATPTTTFSNDAEQVTVRVLTNANLRAGPGTDYPKVGSARAGQSLAIVARNPSGDWYQTTSGAWIFGELLDSAPAALPMAVGIPTPPQTTVPASVAAQGSSTDANGTGVLSVRQGTVAASIRRMLLNRDTLLEFVSSIPLAIMLMPALTMLALCLLVLRLALRRFKSASFRGYGRGYGKLYDSHGYESSPMDSISSSGDRSDLGLSWYERQYEGYDQYERDWREERKRQQREQEERAWEAREAERQERYEQEARIAQEKEQAKWDAWYEREQAKWDAWYEREQAKWDAYYENQRRKYYGDEDE